MTIYREGMKLGFEDRIFTIIDVTRDRVKCIEDGDDTRYVQNVSKGFVDREMKVIRITFIGGELL